MKDDLELTQDAEDDFLDAIMEIDEDLGEDGYWDIEQSKIHKPVIVRARKQMAHSLRNKGYSYSAIARMMKKNRSTITRYFQNEPR